MAVFPSTNELPFFSTKKSFKLFLIRSANGALFSMQPGQFFLKGIRDWVTFPKRQLAPPREAANIEEMYLPLGFPDLSLEPKILL